MSQKLCPVPLDPKLGVLVFVQICILCHFGDLMKFWNRKSGKKNPTKADTNNVDNQDTKQTQDASIDVLASSFSRLSASNKSNNTTNLAASAPARTSSTNNSGGNNNGSKENNRTSTNKSNTASTSASSANPKRSHKARKDQRPPVTSTSGQSTFTALPFSNTTFTTRLRSYTLRTLGSGTTMFDTCKLPRGETCGAWVVVNLVGERGRGGGGEGGGVVDFPAKR